MKHDDVYLPNIRIAVHEQMFGDRTTPGMTPTRGIAPRLIDLNNGSIRLLA